MFWSYLIVVSIILLFAFGLLCIVRFAQREGKKPKFVVAVAMIMSELFGIYRDIPPRDKAKNTQPLPKKKGEKGENGEKI